MTYKMLSRLLIIIFILSNSLIGHSQDTNKQKFKVASYSGGERGFSGFNLILYIDSSYVYSGWDDEGGAWSDGGKYLIHDSIISLHLEIEKRHNIAVARDTVYRYIIRKNTVLMYTKEDEMNYPDIGGLLTLHLDGTKN